MAQHLEVKHVQRLLRRITDEDVAFNCFNVVVDGFEQRRAWLKCHATERGQTGSTVNISIARALTATGTADSGVCEGVPFPCCGVLTFFGTHPTFTQVPPMAPDSIMAAFTPSSFARLAIPNPPDPPPITNSSYAFRATPLNRIAEKTVAQNWLWLLCDRLVSLHFLVDFYDCCRSTQHPLVVSSISTQSVDFTFIVVVDVP